MRTVQIPDELDDSIGVETLARDRWSSDPVHPHSRHWLRHHRFSPWTSRRNGTPKGKEASRRKANAPQNNAKA